VSTANASLDATERAPGHTWSRLALLVAILSAALAFAALVMAWLLPDNLPPRTATYALADLEVGVPHELREPGLGLDGHGRPTSVWLVRSPDDEVSAFWSMTTHPSDCGVEALDLTDSILNSAYAARARAVMGTAVAFRTPCLGSTFTVDGTRLLGPAGRSLDRFPTALRSGYVHVDLSRRILGECTSAGFKCSSAGEPPVIERHRGKL
jgi:hypothetical protein